MRTILLAATLTAAGGIAQAQNPTNRLPNQAELPSPSTSVTPNAGNDEVAARRKLEDVASLANSAAWSIRSKHFAMSASSTNFGL